MFSIDESAEKCDEAEKRKTKLASFPGFAAFAFILKFQTTHPLYKGISFLLSNSLSWCACK